MITDLSQLDPNGTYTYADYLKWQFEQSVELIKGKLYDMSPAPRAAHQRVAMRLLRDILNYFDERTCEVYTAPFDVRLPNPDYEPGYNNKVYTVVQPDICVICDPAKIDEYGCVGPQTGLSRLPPLRRTRKISMKSLICMSRRGCVNTGLSCRKVPKSMPTH